MSYIKFVQSGTLLETYEYEKSPARPRTSPHKRRKRGGAEVTSGEGHRKYVYRSVQNLRRAERAFRRIVRSNLRGDDAPALLTLTLHQELSFRTSVRLFTAFVARLRREAGASFRYVGVPEFQKRGAVHFHVLIWGMGRNFACEYHRYRFRGNWTVRHDCPKNKACERKLRFYQRLWLRGYVDCRVTDGHPKLAGYLAKYMSKSLRDVRLGGEKAYYASRNIMRPVSIAARSGNEFKLQVIREEVIHSGALISEREFDSIWLGRCVYKRFQIAKEVYASGDNGISGDNGKGRA